MLNLILSDTFVEFVETYVLLLDLTIIYGVIRIEIYI